MLTIPSSVNTALQSNNRFWKLKVELTRNNPSSPAIDITDRVVSCDITFDFEKRNGTASLEIDNFDYSLSPLNMMSTTNQVAGVYDPLFDAKHVVKIWYGILTTNGYEYFQRFTGVLGDEIDADTYPGTVQITARDRSKDMQDTYIYQSKTYSMLVVEQVMQDMINEFLPDSGITVTVANPTLFMVGRPDGPYTAKDINLWDALQSLADACDHELRFLEDGTLRLKKVDRDLDEVTPVLDLNTTHLIKDSISISDSEVRNHIVLRVQGLDPIEKKNDASIAKYGRRYMEIHRSLANIITTAEQAHDLVNNLLKDLSYANPIDNIEMPLYPFLQVGDVVTVTNLSTGTDAASFVFRVVRTKDFLDAERKRTTVSLQGYTRFDPADSVAPNAPTGLSNEFLQRVIQNYEGSGWSGASKTISYPLLLWTPPTTDVGGTALTNEFGGYTIYRKKSSESTYFPIASIKSYILGLNLLVNYFYDYTVDESTAYNYKIVAINRFGKTSSESGVHTVTVPAIIYT